MSESQGQIRWNLIQKLKSEGKTYGEIAPIIGLKEGTAVRVWVHRNKTKYEKGVSKQQVIKQKVQKQRAVAKPKPIQEEVIHITAYDDLHKVETTVGAKELLESLLEMCDIKITYLHVKQQEDHPETRTVGEGFTMGMNVELIPKDETVFPFVVQGRITAVAGKGFRTNVLIEEAMREYIETKIDNAGSEMRILKEAMKETLASKEEENFIKSEKHEGTRKMEQNKRT